jgi:YidC/Oxa1 family membrane protein insertase
MTMDRRVLLAVFLSFLVLYAYQALFVPTEPPPVTIQSTPPAAPVTQVGSTTPPPGSKPESPSVASMPPAPAAAPLVGEPAERTIRIESDLVTAVFSNRGAVLESWRLTRYRDEANQPLELVPPKLQGAQERPFTVAVGDPALDARLREAAYRADAAENVLDARTRPVEISFDFEDADGLRVRKSFTIQPGSYVIGAAITVEHQERRLTPTVRWGPALGDIRAEANQYMQLPEAILFRDGSVERLGASSLGGETVHEGTFRFAGVDDHYFLSAALDPGPARLTFAHQPLPHPSGTRSVDLVSYSVRYERTPSSGRFFIGPKDFDVLAAIDRDLVRAINFGWFAWLVVPLLRSLKWINGYVNNYGWAIIILTILINAAMFPLRHKSVVSMRKMQELQPEVKAIQDRYGSLKATDPARQKMNVELMNLYRERGVNPASGCIPMLLTMPVLFAFYSLLSVAIEIRGAPFIGWIRDLSVYDPWYVTPILMGITMVVQQRMTPTTADPVQQKMMMAMPVVFTFMFLWAPSGLVIYWLISNIWAIGQQHVTNRLIGPTAVRTVRPPAERRVKRVGGSKTEGAKNA